MLLKLDEVKVRTLVAATEIRFFEYTPEVPPTVNTP
jgi:hypothetical protein